MKKDKIPISINPSTKRKGQEASRQMFGDVNLSGYIGVLIESDCRKKKIKDEAQKINK